jgi:tRNA (cytidine32/guanosine34-2'-O)-methyltransferase
MFLYLFSKAFVVCQQYEPPAGYVPTMVNPLLDHAYTDFNQLEGVNRFCPMFNSNSFLEGTCNLDMLL